LLRGERTAAPPGLDHPSDAEATPWPAPAIDAPAIDAPPLDAPHDPPPVEARPAPSQVGPETTFVPAPATTPLRVAPATAIAPSPRRPERPRADAPPSHTPADGDDASLDRGATAPQLRRFIKSRAYVPMHELRRRFAINGDDDEVTTVDVDRQRVFVGLPEREGRLLGELLRGGDIGYELSLDPISPIVVGVYPMRPVTRA
jgi:hypothetical protein